MLRICILTVAYCISHVVCTAYHIMLSISLLSCAAMCVFSFYWTKEGASLTMSGDGLTVDAENGTLMIMSPRLEDEGVYQCFASTVFGVAAGVTVQLQQACKSSDFLSCYIL